MNTNRESKFTILNGKYIFTSFDFLNVWEHFRIKSHVDKFNARIDLY